MRPALEDRKRELRRRLRLRIRRIDPKAARAVAGRVAVLAAATPEFRRAARIVLYAAHGGELSTRPLFEAARRAGKAVLLPRAAPRAPLRFAPVARWEELRPGRYGVPEPPPHVAASEVDPGDLVLVPGVAFDTEGHRLGRGGGHYDRTFSSGRGRGACPRPTLFGVAFELQLLDEVPHGPHDVRVDAVVTERRLWRVPGAGPGGGAPARPGACGDAPAADRAGDRAKRAT